jgi:hypothetical protein
MTPRPSPSSMRSWPAATAAQAATAARRRRRRRPSQTRASSPAGPRRGRRRRRSAPPMPRRCRGRRRLSPACQHQVRCERAPAPVGARAPPAPHARGACVCVCVGSIPQPRRWVAGAPALIHASSTVPALPPRPSPRARSRGQLDGPEP